jgi:hypothetical protein
MKKQFLMFSLLASSVAALASGDGTPIAQPSCPGVRHQLIKLKQWAGPKLSECANICCHPGTARGKCLRSTQKSCAVKATRFCLKIASGWSAFNNPEGTSEATAKAEERTRIANLISSDTHTDVTEQTFTFLLTNRNVQRREAAKQARDAVATAHQAALTEQEQRLNGDHQTALTDATTAATQAERTRLAEALFGGSYPVIAEDGPTGLLTAYRVAQRDEATELAKQAERITVATIVYGNEVVPADVTADQIQEKLDVRLAAATTAQSQASGEEEFRIVAPSSVETMLSRATIVSGLLLAAGILRK